MTGALGPKGQFLRIATSRRAAQRRIQERSQSHAGGLAPCRRTPDTLGRKKEVMPVTSKGIRCGPVTLVVAKANDDHRGVLSWTFASEEAAMSVAGAFRNHERWLLVRGVYASADLALASAAKDEIVVRAHGWSGFLPKCDLPNGEKPRSSA